MGPCKVEKFEAEESQASDRREIFYDGYMYDVTNWIPKHPGGKVIEYYTDEKEDATIPIQQFHQRSIKQVLEKMKSLSKRPAADYHLQTERHQKLTEDFQELYHDLLKKGVFEPSLLYVFWRCFEIIACLGLAFYCNCFYGDSFTKNALVILFLTLTAVRSSWLMHEAGHSSLTGNPKYDRVLQILLMGIGDGFSASWWSREHSRHHAMPQRHHRDYDLDTLPFLAFNSKLVAGQKNGNTFFTRHQAKLFLPLDLFIFTCYWKFFLHPRYLIRKKQYGELLAMLTHYIVFIYLAGGLTSYAIVVWLLGNIMFGHFTLSHTHMPVTTENLHWVEYSLLHTIDIEPSSGVTGSGGTSTTKLNIISFPQCPSFDNDKLLIESKR